MVKMKKNGKKYDIAPERVDKLLKRGYTLVKDTPAPKDVETDHEDLEQDGEI